MQLEYHGSPFPHLVVPRLMAPQAYAQLRFPEIAPQAGGRTGMDLFPGEPAWEAAMAEPGWKAFGEELMTEAFLRQVVGAFAKDLQAVNAALDPEKVYLEPYAESREDLDRQVLSEDADPNALFFRFDFQAAGPDYRSFVHVDWSRRVVGGVLFFCDADEEGMVGGEFGLYRDEEFRGDRICHRPQLMKAIAPRHNTGVLFLNSNRGFHGPVPIRRMSGLRRWVYFSISSRRNIWPLRVQPRPAIAVS
jgi:hypothetical protein